MLGVDIPFEEPKGAGPHALRRINGQNTRQVENYRDGRVLLLGDAAHVHSPLGGPGLNLGLQDTMNLGWKLAAQINGTAPDGLLDTYQSERYPVGQRVIMHSLAQIALMSPGPEVAALRTLLGELFTLPDAQTHMAALLAGSDVGYDVGDDHPLSGHLVPDLTFDDGRRVAEVLHDARPVLLDLDGNDAVLPPRLGGSRRYRQRQHCRPARRGDTDPARRLRRLGSKHIRCGSRSGTAGRTTALVRGTSRKVAQSD